MRRLKLFNEKVEEIRGYSFLGKALHQDAGVQLKFDCESQLLEANRIGADREARAAMCLVLRFFRQRRDGIELHQMAKLYQGLPVADEDKHWVADNLKELDEFLDRSTGLALNGNPITHRVVLETFLYGDQAHANPDKKVVLETWKEIAPIHMMLENFFEYAACQVLRFVLWLAAMNDDTIRTLQQTAAA